MISGPLFWLCLFTTVYVYAGYPLLLYLLTRFFSKPPLSAAPYTPAVTLIIAAYNEERMIAAKLENALALDYPRDRLEIIVATDGSEDHTPEIVEGFASRGVRLSHRPLRSGKMAAINRAVQRAAGEILLFSDANNLYRPGALMRLTAPFADPAVGAVSGAKRILQDGDALGHSEGFYWKYESFIKTMETRLGSTTGAAGEIFALRRELFSPPPAQIINDDFFMAMLILKGGHRVVYVPEACSWEPVSASAGDEIIRRSRIVAGRYQAMFLSSRFMPWRSPLLVWQVVSHKFLRPLVPLAMIGAFCGALTAALWPPAKGAFPWLRLATPWGLLFLILQSLFYLLALLGNSLSGRGGRWGRLLYLPAFLVNSNLAALKGLLGFLSRRQGVLWQRVRRREEPKDE